MPKRRDRETYGLRSKEIQDRLSGEKLSKETVDYRKADTDSTSRCKNCEFYEYPGQVVSSCKKVAGQVYADDLCEEFIIAQEVGLKELQGEPPQLEGPQPINLGEALNA